MNNDANFRGFGSGMSYEATAGQMAAWEMLPGGGEGARYVVETLRHELVQTAHHHGVPETDIRRIVLGSPEEVVKAHVAALPHIQAWRRVRAAYVAQVQAEQDAKHAARRAVVTKRRAKVKAASASRRAQRKAAR